MLFLSFSIGGGVVVGAVLGGILGSYRFAEAVFGIVAMLLVSRDFFRVRIPLPQVRLQVPEALKARRVLGPIVYGALLGAGVLTYLPSAVVYIYVLALLLLASAAQGALVGGIFGTAYAMAVLVLGASTARLTVMHQAAHLKALFSHRRSGALLLAAIISILLALSPAGDLTS